MKSKEEYWVRLFACYERSGLSQEDFCSEQGIPIEKFKYQWRKKFGSRNNKTKSQNRLPAGNLVKKGHVQFLFDPEFSAPPRNFNMDKLKKSGASFGTKRPLYLL